MAGNRIAVCTPNFMEGGAKLPMRGRIENQCAPRFRGIQEEMKRSHPVGLRYRLSIQSQLACVIRNLEFDFEKLMFSLDVRD
ncbi:hypothetical protein M404DRAFT_1003170 [Pisolithus tinctorius Marx 270]|uniref:Uncharacterized protein n=1 Tax=Pisolithus tinctorius Marx 270 TaxID=870435 RepID=A0A0C3IXB5_PISTI|nr:hypothetical protein M404DRAFT_1003170 [Pisolithus tinctorius Marx 270]